MARLIVEPEVLTAMTIVRSAKWPLSKAQILVRGMLADIVAEERSPYQRAG